MTRLALLEPHQDRPPAGSFESIWQATPGMLLRSSSVLATVQRIAHSEVKLPSPIDLSFVRRIANRRGLIEWESNPRPSRHPSARFSPARQTALPEPPHETSLLWVLLGGFGSQSVPEELPRAEAINRLSPSILLEPGAEWIAQRAGVLSRRNEKGRENDD